MTILETAITIWENDVTVWRLQQNFMLVGADQGEIKSISFRRLLGDRSPGSFAETFIPRSNAWITDCLPLGSETTTAMPTGQLYWQDLIMLKYEIPI